MPLRPSGRRGQAKENTYGVLSVNLVTERLTATEIMYEGVPATGSSWSILACDGTAILRLNAADADPILITAAVWPRGLTEFSSIWIENTEQTGKSLTIIFGTSV